MGLSVCRFLPAYPGVKGALPCPSVPETRPLARFLGDAVEVVVVAAAEVTAVAVNTGAVAPAVVDVPAPG